MIPGPSTHHDSGRGDGCCDRVGGDNAELNVAALLHGAQGQGDGVVFQGRCHNVRHICQPAFGSGSRLLRRLFPPPAVVLCCRMQDQGVGLRAAGGEDNVTVDRGI